MLCGRFLYKLLPARQVDASPHAAASPQSQRRAILRAGLLSGLVATVGSLAMCGLFYATVLKPAQNSLAAATLQMQEVGRTQEAV